MEQLIQSVKSTKSPWLTALLLAAFTLALFSPAISHNFLNYDDDLYVYANPAVLRGLNWSGLNYALTSQDAGTWAPITWLSYELDTTLLGARASSYHTTNILLHAAAGMFLFLALRLMLKSDWAGAVVAGIFLMHPLRTESVVWIAERKDVLCAFFWSLGLLAYWFYAGKPNALRWALVFVCFLFGAMSKMMMVTFPFVLLLLDFWPLERVSRSSIRNLLPLVREKIPFFIVSVLVVFVSSLALNAVGTLAPVGAEASTKLLRVMENYVFYLGKIFWPVRLSILYPTESVQASTAVLSGLLLAAITLFALWQMRRMPWLLVGWLWFLGALVPVIGFVTFGHFYVGDRYTYIPSIGLMLTVVVALERLLRRFPLARWTGAAAAIALCAVVTRTDLPRWQNAFTLYDAALEVGPHHVAYNNRGTAYRATGDRRHAWADFNAAIRLKPDYAAAYGNRAAVWIDLGKYDEAIADCTRAIKLAPHHADAFNNRGNAFSRMGEFDKAVSDYNSAIKLNPGKPLYYNNRAAAYFSLKQPALAKADVDKCVQLGGQPHTGLARDLDEVIRLPGH